MKVKLIDYDSKIPNLALMQLSTYHKQKGDEVGFNIENPDYAYLSCIFTKNRESALESVKSYDCHVEVGGTGVDLHKEIPIDAQKCYPDYSLYPDCDFSLGFTSRGCIRHCPFCVVYEKEGKYRRWQHVSEFYNPSFKKLELLDNNIYADKEWFFDNTDFILDHKLKLNITQGMDIRILTPEIAERLGELKWYKPMTFAWDNIKDEEKVIEGLSILTDAGIKLKQRVQVYVLCGFNSTFKEDLYRVNKLREYGCNAFVMQYGEGNRLCRCLAHWCNRRWNYWSHTFEEHDRYINLMNHYYKIKEYLNED